MSPIRNFDANAKHKSDNVHKCYADADVLSNCSYNRARKARDSSYLRKTSNQTAYRSYNMFKKAQQVEEKLKAIVINDVN